MLRVLTLHFGSAEYLRLTRGINERYCAKWGLEFVVAEPEDQRSRRGLDPIWSKVTAARRALEGCDSLLYLDGDAFLVDRELPPEALTERLPAEKSMLVGEERAGVANTGVWLVRNNDTGRAILDAWIATPRADPTLAHRWPLDEAGFNERVLPEFLSAIELPSRTSLDLRGGPFIRHLCMRTIAAKADALRKFINA